MYSKPYDSNTVVELYDRGFVNDKADVTCWYTPPISAHVSTIREKEGRTVVRLRLEGRIEDFERPGGLVVVDVCSIISMEHKERRNVQPGLNGPHCAD